MHTRGKNSMVRHAKKCTTERSCQVLLWVEMKDFEHFCAVSFLAVPSMAGPCVFLRDKRK